MAKSKANRLKNQSDSAIAALELALTAQRRFGEKAVELCEQLELDAAIQSSGPTEDQGLNRPELRSWLCEGIQATNIRWCPRMVGTSGSGPWQIEEFDEFLVSMGFELAYLPRDELKCIVLGAEGWDEDALSEQIYNRDGSDLIVLSQALFVAGLLKNASPLDALDKDELLAMAEAHPALSFLVDRGFDWFFETLSNAVTEWEPNQELAEKSPLRLAGYSVASGGPGEDARRDVLETFFFDKAPTGVESPADRKRWGPAKSAQRLYGMATFIAWLCRFQGTNAPQAVARWKEDLSWLRKEFFRPTMQFEWPSQAQQGKVVLKQAVSSGPKKPMFTLGDPVPPTATRPSTTKPAQTILNPAAAWPFPTGNKS